MTKNLISLLLTFAVLFSLAESSKLRNSLTEVYAKNQAFIKSDQLIQAKGQNADEQVVQKSDGTLSEKTTELLQSTAKTSASASAFFEAGQTNCFNQCYKTYKAQVYWYPQYSKYFCCAVFVHLPVPGNLGWYRQSCAPVYLNC
ncbi:hypothetical protein ABPG74_019223 [Tetrahymena malaccensis]